VNEEAIKALMAVLPGPPTRNRKFIGAVVEEIRAYRADTVPFTRQRELDAHRIEKLAAAAAVFANAVHGASACDWLIEQKIMMAARRSGMHPDAALAHAAAEWAEIQKAAKVARRLAKTAPMLKRHARPLKPQAALKSLVFFLAIAYCEAYGYRPSAAEEGHFARAVSIVCQAEKIPDKAGGTTASPGEAWLQSVINDPQILKFPPPARGRKARAN